jgi:hypothetical protein
MNKRRYHHLGLIATQPMEGEYFIENWKISFTPYDQSEFHLQWCRYHEGCPLPELIKTIPHVAFIVDDLQKALEGKKLIYGPFFPTKNWRVAFIEVKNAERTAFESKSLSNEVRYEQ